MLLFNLISILRPISNFLALFKLCDYNLILLTNVKLFEKHLSAHKTRCRWPDDRFWGLHDYITQRHPLTLLRHQSDSLLQRQRFVQKLLRETLWLDRQNWSSAERARCFLGVLRLYPPRHILLQMSPLSRQLSKEVTCFGNVKNTLKFSEPWLVKISLPDFLLTKFWTSGQPPFPTQEIFKINKVTAVTAGCIMWFPSLRWSLSKAAG